MTYISALGYIGIGVRDLSAWRSFAAEILGAQVTGGGGPEESYLRVDDRQYRVVIFPGEDQLEFTGWEVATPEDFNALLRDLSAAGVPFKDDAELAARRGAAQLVTCSDPAGRALEFYRGSTVVRENFVSPTGARFVTKDPDGRDLGLGHIVLTFPDASEAAEFYFGTLRFKLSDTVTLRPGTVARFAHVNPRHHSLAFIQSPPGAAPALNHFMLEVEDVDMVGRALDQVHEHGISKIASLGRHSNDLMLSFYMRSPSGFGIEYGCQGLLIDDTAWTAVNYASPHVWGHDQED